MDELDRFPSETSPSTLWPLFLREVVDMYFRGILLHLGAAVIPSLAENCLGGFLAVL